MWRRKACLLPELIHWRGRNWKRQWELGRMESVEAGICASGSTEKLQHLPRTEICGFPKRERSLSEGYFPCFDLHLFPFVHTSVARQSNWRDLHHEKSWSQIEAGIFFCLFFPPSSLLRLLLNRGADIYLSLFPCS